MSDPVLDAARRYVALGFSVIPVRPGSKEPAIGTWGGYQKRAANDGELARWFGDGRGVAIICGAVSGGLAVRDFDSMPAYEAWAGAHPALAKTLPTVATARGRHVYGRLPGAKTRKLGDGELRGEGGYVVAPPSVHPDGPRYEWLVPLAGPPPTVTLADLAAEGAATEKQAPEAAPPAPSDAQSTREPEQQRDAEQPIDGFSFSDSQSLCFGVALGPEDAGGVVRAMEATVPDRGSVRNGRLFDFARRLKGIAGVKGMRVGELIGVVQEWHRRALPAVATKDFETTWEDFVHAWANVRCPKGVNPLDNIGCEIEGVSVPVVVAKMQMPKLALLARVCIVLQRKIGESAFFLATKDAARILDLGEDRTRAWKLLKMLVRLGFLVEAEPGNEHRATRYRVVGGPH